jgi:hypothetical protein
MPPLSQTAISIAIVGFVLAFASCGAASSNLSVAPDNPRQLNNSNLQFSASRNGKDFSNRVQWSSSNPTVASVRRNRQSHLVERRIHDNQHPGRCGSSTSFDPADRDHG